MLCYIILFFYSTLSNGLRQPRHRASMVELNRGVDWIFLWVSVCVCGCVFWSILTLFFDVFFIFGISWVVFGSLLEHFELHFGKCWLPGRCPGLPWGALGSPWAPGWPQQRSGSEKLVRWTPPWLPKWGHFGINFNWFFEQKKALVFDWIMVTILSGKWCQNASRNH